jgi:hypothetical protein
LAPVAERCIVFSLRAACIGSLGYAWEAHREKTTLYRDEFAQFERGIPDLAKMYHLLPYDIKCTDLDQTPLCPPGFVEVKQPDGSFSIYSEDVVPDGSPPAGLPLTRDQLAQAIKTKEPAYQTSENENVVNQFLDRYPRWRTALVEDGASGDSQPKWYADAVAAGVNINAVPEAEKPDPPEPPKLWQSVGNGWVLIVLGLLLFFVGVGLLFGVKPNRNDSEIRSVSGG